MATALDDGRIADCFGVSTVAEALARFPVPSGTVTVAPVTEDEVYFLFSMFGVSEAEMEQAERDADCFGLFTGLEMDCPGMS